MIKQTIKKLIPTHSYLRFVWQNLSTVRQKKEKMAAFKKEFQQFKSSEEKGEKRFTIDWQKRMPCLNDNTIETPIDYHYIYHPAWAARVLAKINPAFHVDISSKLDFSIMLSAFIPVKFYDYRPAPLCLNNLESNRGDLLALPFESNSLHTISCMHTIEHIGLGRYGDPLDYNGDLKAIQELIRVARPDGAILFVTPVGKPQIIFNAHRIYSFEQIRHYFSSCTLVEFSLITDEGSFIENADTGLVALQQYGCGCFWFKKNVIENL